MRILFKAFFTYIVDMLIFLFDILFITISFIMGIGLVITCVYGGCYLIGIIFNVQRFVPVAFITILLCLFIKFLNPE